MKVKPNYIIIPLITILISVLGSWFTSQGMDGWYENLVKPEWTPDGSFIGAMWTFIYVLVTGVVLIYWNKYKDDPRFKLVIGLFILNAFLNVTWSLSFFTLELLAFSFAHIIALNLTILALIVLIWPTSKYLAIALIPYTAWVTVASVLNYSIWMLN